MAKRKHRGLEAPGLLFLRQRSGLSQEELATRSGVSLSTVARLETGHWGNYEKLDALAAALSRELGESITRQTLRTPPSTDLKSLRTRCGLTQQQLAAKAQVDVEVVRLLETDPASYFHDLDALATVLTQELGESITRVTLLPPLGGDS